MRILLTLLAIAVLFGGVIAYIVLSEPEPTEQTLVDAEAAMAQQNHDEALRLVNKYIARYPDSARGYAVAGSIFLERQEIDKAYDFLQKALADDNPRLLETRFICGRLAQMLGRVAEAENHLRAVLVADPNHAQAHSAMFNLLRLEGRNSELPPHFMSSIRQRQLNLRQLLVMAQPEYAHLESEDGDFVKACMEAVPDDPLPMLGQARSMLEGTQTAESLPILIDVVHQHPDILTAQALLGMALLRVGTPAQQREWLQQLPADRDQDAEVWYVLGMMSAERGHAQTAARCYWEGLRVNSIHRPSAYRLGQTLAGIDGFEQQALQFSDYAADLSALAYDAYEAGPNAPEKMRGVAEGMKRFGRIWEAAGWCFAAMQIPSEADWAEIEATRLIPQLQAEPPFVLATSNPASDLDLTGWPLPDLDKLVPADGASEPTPAPDPGFLVTFREEARDRGLEFAYFNAGGEGRMFEFSGGGVSVLDFDRDGWPDAYLTQGAEWPVKPTQTTYLDQLYRNVQGEHFDNVSGLAIAADNGYTQGAAVGDVDNDGFPDLFVANIGPNRLYHNNGDGTFTEMDLTADQAGDVWTIGGVVGDVTGDGIPDIYALNYLGGDDVYTRECYIGNRRRQCAPGYFSAEPDRLFVGDGNGLLVDRSAEAGIQLPGGKGMGIVSVRLDEQPLASLYISNDSTPNFLLTNTGREARFEEHALLSGVALGADGKGQSSMGLSVGDVNNDGYQDIFVTNFSREANNLFLQQPGGFFEDRIDSSGLREPGYGMMGWGTQFLDANLDGNLDLLVANGHLEDRGKDVQSTMPTQYFQNVGGGRFVQGPAAGLGAYFGQSWFGRAVARADWNRDGLPDALVTHTYSPVALLTNTTAQHGDSVRLICVGSDASSRDALGATLRLRLGDRTLMRQVTGGDGFMASNQKLVIFGVLPDETLQSLVVEWPSGVTQTITEIPRNQDLILQEGSDRLLVLPH